jgi:hypothetical protein
MKYITYDYYVSRFLGTTVPEEEFDYLATAASTVVDALVTRPIEDITDVIRRAVAYETETLYIQGGADAIAGFASITSGIDERIGDYTVGTPYVSNEKRIYSVGGVPVSGLTLALLKGAGLMCRCVYTGDCL